MPTPDRPDDIEFSVKHAVQLTPDHLMAVIKCAFYAGAEAQRYDGAKAALKAGCLPEAEYEAIRTSHFHALEAVGREIAAINQLGAARRSASQPDEGTE